MNDETAHTVETAKSAVEAFCGQRFAFDDTTAPQVRAAALRLLGQPKGRLPRDVEALLGPFVVAARLDAKGEHIG